MKTPASVMGHPVHAILVAYPIGLWTFALVCDVVALLRGDDSWSRAALYAVGVGVAGALLAAVPGFIDLLSLRHHEAWATGVKHMAVNLAAVVVFAASFVLRLGDDTGAASSRSPSVRSGWC